MVGEKSNRNTWWTWHDKVYQLQRVKAIEPAQKHQIINWQQHVTQTQLLGKGNKLKRGGKSNSDNDRREQRRIHWEMGFRLTPGLVNWMRSRSAVSSSRPSNRRIQINARLKIDLQPPTNNKPLKFHHVLGLS